ncbi:MAG: hypothetical protein AAGD00_00785 [Planctomycetota bacterium]
MTIAACHVSPEGVVLGADSTTTIASRTGNNVQLCYFDHAQKLFEIGPPGSTLGLVTWGMGQIGTTSHREIASRVGKLQSKSPLDTVEAIAQRTAETLWAEFSAAFATEIQQAVGLQEREESGDLTDAEARLLDQLRERRVPRVTTAGQASSATPERARTSNSQCGTGTL